MTQNPMKVSEAVDRLRHRAWAFGEQQIAAVYTADLLTLIASHDALVQAAGPFAEVAEHLHPASPNEGLTLDGIEVGQWRALSLAVEDAGR